MSPVITIPPVTIPGVPPGVNACLRQVYKKGEGARKFAPGKPYRCPTGETMRSNTTFSLKLHTGGAPCDQDPALIPDGSVLTATGNTIWRADGLAHFAGSYRIVHPRGRILYYGVIEIIDRVGTHPQEPCNPRSHFEGWLVGRSGRGLEVTLLRAMIAGTSRLLDKLPTDDYETPVQAMLNGVVIGFPADG